MRLLVGVLVALALFGAARNAGAVPTSTLRIQDARVLEGDAGTTVLRFTITAEPAPKKDLTVDVSTEDGTATVADGDYQGFDGPVTFPRQETSVAVDVLVHGDGKLEVDESIGVRIAASGNVELADDFAVGVIANDERAPFAWSGAVFEPFPGGFLGPAWGDVEGDGDVDPTLYRNRGGLVFELMSEFLPLLDDGNYHGSSWCDYDKDGDADLVVLAYSVFGETRTRLIRNEGGASFTDAAPQLGLDEMGFGETPVWGDFDADGWPDLFAPYYSHTAPYRSFLYRNDGDGTFTDVAEAAGVSLPGIPFELRPEGSSAVDLDDDGDLDLYCASHLFINDGTGLFTDEREVRGLPVDFDEGARFVDFDNDGDFDLYVRASERPKLHRNDGGVFTDVSAAAGLPQVPLLFGDSWVDAENDGDLDLLLLIGDEPARLLLNRGDGTFFEDPDFAALDVRTNLSVWGDADGDGDRDVLLGAGDKELLENRVDTVSGAAVTTLRVRVLDESGRRVEHGAGVRLVRLGDPGAGIQSRYVDGGSGYLVQEPYTLQFGVSVQGSYALEVRFPKRLGVVTVLDSTANPMLGNLRPWLIGAQVVEVYRDGRVELRGSEVVAVEPGLPAPGFVHLGTPVPNPSTGFVRLPLSLPEGAGATIEILDLRGRRIRSLDPATTAGGAREIVWDRRTAAGAPAPAGVYWVRLRLDSGRAEARRVVILNP